MVGRAIKARGQVTLTKLYDGTNGTDGKNGSDGAVGAPGEDGKTTYVHVAYSSSADGKTNFSITDPSGRSYIGVLTDFTEKDSTKYSDYTWSLVKGQDGQNGEDGAPGAPGEDGKTTYIHIAYSNSAEGKTDFSTTENSGKKYIGVLTDEIEKDSTDYTQYSWSLFKGKDGEDGADGTPGKPGADGRTPYVHFAYANSADGNTDFSTTVYANKKFIGTLTDYTVADSTDYTKYTWTLIKGADGANGTPGKPGSDGKTPYIHFAYANSSDGKTDFSVTDYTNKKFIGTLTDYVVPDSTDYTKYTWSRLKGESGVGIANTVVEYQITDTQDQPSEDSGWTSSIPNLGTGSYLWTRTTFFYTDGTTSRAYTISKQSDNTYTAVLTNDSITLPSDSNGKVTDFSNSTGNFLVYDGTYQVDSTTIKVQLVQAVNVTVTLGGNAYTITAMDSTKDTGYFDLSYTYKGVALTKRVSVSKSKSGANGTTPIIVNLSANAQVFTFDSNNHANPTSQNILFKTTVSGTTAMPIYKAIPYDKSGNTGAEIVMSNSGTNGKMLQVSQLKDYISILVTASIGSVSDSTTIVRVKDGSSISPIPDPSNTVSSNTPPNDAKDGDWWNDTSQTPNVLKYRYRDKWVQYELDGYYVKANSISGEAIVTNTLEAQKIKYTNSNGTTTNLQTFDFSGMKTLLTDTKGNTYSNMESAVGSTKVVSSLQKKVNDLGQVNQLINTEFSPDFSGWYDRDLHGKAITASLGTPVDGSNVFMKVDGSPTRLQSEPIPVTPGMKVSYSVNKLTSITIWSYLNASDKDGNIINVPNTSSNEIAGASQQNIGFKKWENITIPDGVFYISFGLYVPSVIPNGSLFSQPMLVFSGSVGDYAPGQYNNNARVLKIEESADKFQISIGKSVKDVQSSADSANTKVDNLSTGDRNYILDTANPKTQTSNGKNNQDLYNSAVFYSPIKNWGIANGDYIISFDWVLKTALSSDMQATVFFNQSPWQSQNFTIPAGQLKGHVDSKFKLWASLLATTPDVVGLNFRIMSQMASGNTITYSNLFMKSGTIITTWTPAPEDVQSGITSAQNIADSAKTKIDNLSVGGRNLLLGTANSFTGTGSNSTNSNFNAQGGKYSLAGGKKVSDLYNQYGSSGYLTVSFDWVASGSTISGQFNPQWSLSPYGGLSDNGAIKPSSTNTSGHYESTVSLRNNGYSNGVAGSIEFRQDSLQGNITISNLKLESGNKATDWTPAPEDVQSGIDTAQSGVNTLSQVNLINNSDFSPDLAGWTSRGTGNFTTGTYDYAGGVYVVENTNTNTIARTSSAPIPLNSSTGQRAYSLSFNSYIFNLPSGGRVTSQLTFLDSNLNETSSSYPGFTELTSNGTGKWVNTTLNNITFTPPTGAVYVVFSFDTRGIGTKAGFNRPILVKGASVGSYVRGDYGMSTTTVLKLTADNYSMGIDVNGNLISGISGNKQQVTLKGNAINLDGNTNVTGDFYAKGGNFTNINIANVSGNNPSLIKSNFDNAYGNVSITPTNITLQSYSGNTLMTELAIGNLGITIKMPGISSFLDSTIINANGMSFQHSGGSYATVGVMDAGFTLEHNQLGGAPMSIRIGDGGTPNGGKNSANDMVFAISAAQDNGTSPQLIWAGSRVGKITTKYRTWNNPAGFIIADNIKFSTWDDTASRVEIDDTVNYYNYAPVQVHGMRFTDGDRSMRWYGKNTSSGAKWFGLMNGQGTAGFGIDNTEDVLFFMKNQVYSLYTMLGKLGMR